MCGISGFIDLGSNSSEDILNKMSNTLNHRGPDGSGTFFIEKNQTQIGLAHKRLSIIDLSDTGKQPMFHQELSITFNGEIYNFQEIKTELEKTGNTFIGHSDTEVILQAYKKWGSDCLHKFTGMFAFVIYDSIKNEIFCARDRAGVKPFYYYHHKNLFLFGSELKTFHQHPSFKKEVNFNAVAAFMQFGNVPGSHCIFNNCHKLSPGHFLKLKISDFTPEIIRYWNVYDYYNKPKLNISFPEAQTETEKILNKAFRYRMVSDVPVGVFLSGGYDSTCLAALLQKKSHEKLKTFTIGVPDIGLDEAPYAKAIASHLGTEHTELYCSDKDAFDLIQFLPYYYDEPFADASAIPTMLVSNMARKEVKVALSADAGDEVFAGYNRYDYLMKHGKKLNTIPKSLRIAAAHLMDKIPSEKIPVLKNTYNFNNRYEKLKILLHNPSPKNMMLSLSSQYTNSELKKLFSCEFTELNTAYLSSELKNEYFSELAYMMAIDYQTYLCDDILQKVDRASMSQSLEARDPFLDHNVIEWAAQLPDEYKYKNGIKKYIVKEIVHQYIPKHLLDRPKMGFAIPIEKWLATTLKSQVLFYLNSDLIKSQNIFNNQYVDSLTKSFYEGKKELASKIWYLLMFQMWYEKWMK